uniref:(California timema) hypothetical protein n=1 Tax=Timema californicum TaxID=61474 RepID=A0A7R9P5E3_TIMCA|nr:unnamed protein product [Timema californicum]
MHAYLRDNVRLYHSLYIRKYSIRYVINHSNTYYSLLKRHLGLYQINLFCLQLFMQHKHKKQKHMIVFALRITELELLESKITAVNNKTVFITHPTETTYYKGQSLIPSCTACPPPHPPFHMGTPILILPLSSDPPAKLACYTSDILHAFLSR